MHRHTAWLWAVAVPFVSLVAAAAPQGEAPQTDARALAETLFFTGRGLMEGGRYAQACQKFAESYRLDPAAGTLLNLAVCHEKEGKIATAWGEYRQALAEARKANRPDREQLTKDAIARLEPDLPYVTITVPAGVRVAGLQVARNGVPLNEAAWDTELPIDPGQNEITATAPDYDEEKKTLTIEKRQHLTIALEPLVYHPPPKPPPPWWTAQRKTGAGLLIGGGVLAVAGGVFGALALSNKSKSDDNCPLFDGERRCNAAGADAMSTAKTDALVSDIGLGLGVVGVVVGGYMVLTGGAKEEGPPTPPRAEPRAAWGWDVKTSVHGVQGLVSRSF